MSSKSNEGFVVLFGSSAAGAANPRDLDVVVGGRYSVADAESAARAWWLVEHLGAERAEALTREAVATGDGTGVAKQVFAVPPVEVHRQNERRDGKLCAYLLRPRGAETKAIVLRGEVEIEWYDVDSLPAALRLAVEGHADAAREMTSRLRSPRSGRLPLSMAEYDAGRPIGFGGYSGDGPVALEQALARTGDQEIGLGGLLPSIADLGLIDLFPLIRSNPGVWSGQRWKKGQEPPMLTGLRRHWQGGTPLGCQGWVGTDDVTFNYAPPLSLSMIREIIESSAGVSR